MVGCAVPAYYTLDRRLSQARQDDGIPTTIVYYSTSSGARP